MNIILASQNQQLRHKIHHTRKHYKTTHRDESFHLDRALESTELTEQKSTKLPKIRKPQKYYIFHQHTKTTNHSLYTSIQPSMGNLENSIVTENPEELSNKRIREIISQFDRT